MDFYILSINELSSTLFYVFNLNFFLALQAQKKKLVLWKLVLFKYTKFCSLAFSI
jgi:hypothetical protein